MKNESMMNLTTNRILQHFQDDSSLAIISSYRTERTEAENKALLQKLKKKVRSLGLGFTELLSKWTEEDKETGEVVSSDERSLMIYGISLKDAVDFGKELQQSSIIYKSKDKCAEVCTIEFVDFDGVKHKEREVVRKFNIRGTSPLNLEDAKNIFEKRKGGPTSKPLKSNRAFRLAELHEVESPRGSIFSDGKERYLKIF